VSRCLGPRIADLADGRLAPAEAEKAFAHVAVCATCRDALAAQRAVISRLDTVGPVEPSTDLFARLVGISSTDPSPVPATPAIPVQGGAGPRPGGAAGRRPAGSASGSVRPPSRGRRGRIVLASAAGAAALAVAVVVGGSSALTSAVVSRPSVAPVVDTLTAEHVVSADQMPFAGPRIELVAYADPSASVSPTPVP
jgi:hypothetical protein